MIQVDSKYTYIVVVGWDYGFRYKSFYNLPRREMRRHEFGDEKSMNEYINLLKGVNDDKIGTFYWEITKRPIKESKKFQQHQPITSTYKKTYNGK